MHLINADMITIALNNFIASNGTRCFLFLFNLSAAFGIRNVLFWSSNNGIMNRHFSSFVPANALVSKLTKTVDRLRKTLPKWANAERLSNSLEFSWILKFSRKLYIFRFHCLFYSETLESEWSWPLWYEFLWISAFSRSIHAKKSHVVCLFSVWMLTRRRLIEKRMNEKKQECERFRNVKSKKRQNY